MTGILKFFLITATVWASSGPPKDLPPLPSSHLDSTSHDLFLLKMEKECDSDSCRWWAKYVRGLLWAKTSADTSCGIFTSLAEDDDFPLFPVVLAKQAEICDLPEGETLKILENIKKYIADEKPKRWLEASLTSAAVNLAEKQSRDLFFTTTMDAVRLARTKKSKIGFLQRLLGKPKIWEKDRLKEIQSELWKLSPKLNPIPSDWLAVGIDALASQDPDLAVLALEKVARRKTNSSLVRRQALENLRVAYKMLQNKSETLNASARLWAFDLARKGRSQEFFRSAHNSGIALARAYWTEHDNASARKILARVEKLVRGKFPLGELHFVKARIYEEEGKTKQAIKWFTSAAKNTSDRQFESLYKWHVAWLLFKEGDFQNAATALKELKEVETEPGRKAQQIFWLGKALRALGQEENARIEWEKLIGDDPFGYYSLVSYRELKRVIPKEPENLPPDAAKPSRKEVSFKKANWDFFDWLVAVGEFSLARQMLSEEAPLPDPTTEDWSELLRRYVQAQSYAGIFSRMSRLTPYEKHKIFRENPLFLFPNPYQDLVSDMSQSVGLWPEYVLAIMRQESSFDALSVSPAFAFGLLQILPSVAKKIAPHYGIKIKETSDLLDPALNIRLGTSHLRDYWDMYEGQFLLTTASYNASPDTVKSWVKTRFRGDPLMFIEDIPYEETRSYVKLVLRNFINYQRIYGSVPQTFPEWCLEGIQAFKK